eukprot:TRINITY_DN52182_c0_g1_i1.p1 TRINITY_DN52182_c0_g1~~TRINITY_DN52182_c0_g1_i1.p1  ORF type:complete len:292 (-),score=44.01 TRINITY_DN52182_c0_g1_i1:18-893(-)
MEGTTDCWTHVAGLAGYFPGVSHVALPRSLCCNPPANFCFNEEVSVELCCGIPTDSSARCLRHCRGTLNYYGQYDEAGGSRSDCLLQRLIDAVHAFTCIAWTPHFIVLPRWNCKLQDADSLSEGRCSDVDNLRALAIDCDLSENELFRYAGVTRKQLDYLIWMSCGLWPDHPPWTVYSATKPLAMDLGSKDGLDAAFYLQSGMSVVAVEASEVNLQLSRQRLARWLPGGQLLLVHAAVSERNGETVLYTDRFQRSSIVANFTDSSGLDGLASQKVQGLTCATLVRMFGLPL